MKSSLHFYLFILSSILYSGSYAQQISVFGRVSIFNCKTKNGKIEYVKGVYIEADSAKSSITDDSGQFKLVFVGKAIGTSTRIKLTKSGLVPVNDWDLNNVIIGRASALQIYLSKPGQIEEDSIALYSEMFKSIITQKNSLILKLRSDGRDKELAIREIENRFGKYVRDRNEAEALLNLKIDSLIKQLPNICQLLVRQNLDFASDLYLNAYNQFKKGNVDSVLILLKPSVVTEFYQQAINNINRGKNLEGIGKQMEETGYLQIQEIINSYYLKAITYSLKFEYLNSAHQYDSIIKICNDQILGPNILAFWYNQAADRYNFASLPLKSLDYQQKAISIESNLNDFDSLNIAMLLFNEGVSFTILGQYDSALFYQLKGIKILQEKIDSNSLELATPYGYLAVSFHNLGNYKYARLYFDKQINILVNKFGKLDLDLAGAYVNLGNTCIAESKFNEALDKNRFAMNICYANGIFISPTLATAEFNCSEAFRYLNKVDSAKIHLNIALNMYRKLLGDQCIQLARVYMLSSDLSLKDKDIQSALAFSKKDISIQLLYRDSSNVELGKSFAQIAFLYAFSRREDTAEIYFNLAMKIFEKSIFKSDLFVADYLNDFATININAGERQKAIRNQKKALKIYGYKLVEADTNYLKALNTLAKYYYLDDKFDSALEYLKLEIGILEKNANSTLRVILIKSYSQGVVIAKALGNQSLELFYKKKKEKLKRTIHT
ncbi:MAG TPA: tetratricopeptide repeat protein [Puia sp.]|nr:tetratricopeptide repeat protein [Puia sp.]